MLPPVNVHDNARLRNNEYAIRVRGVEVARGTLQPGNWLAIDATGTLSFNVGISVSEPTFGFPAWWVTTAQREQAEARGLTVVDAAGVLSTHLAESIRRHAGTLLSRQDVSEMIDRVKEKCPAVVQDLIPGRLSVGVVHRVLQHLLRERVSVRDLASILETLGDHVGKTQDATILGELSRRALGGQLIAPYLEVGSKLPALALHPELEALLHSSVQRDNSEMGMLALPPEQAQGILQNIGEILKQARKRNRHPVLVVLPALRLHIRRLVESRERDLAIISFAEIPDTVDVDIVGLVALPKAAQEG